MKIESTDENMVIALDENMVIALIRNKKLSFNEHSEVLSGICPGCCCLSS